METVIIVVVITLAVVIAFILGLLGILFYNKMLADNELNKRLILIAKESIDKERSTQEELQQALLDLDRATNENQSGTPANIQEDVTPDEPFNPHTYSEDFEG